MPVLLNVDPNILEKINSTSKNRNDEDYKHIVNEIVSLIDKGELQPGQSLPGERDLAEAFDSGRSNIRVALKMLEFFGIVESKAGKGTSVTENPGNLTFINMINLFEIVSSNPFEEIIEARIALEPQMAALAAINRDDHDLIVMKNALLKQEHNENIVTTADEFHIAIFKSTKNSVLIKIAFMLNDLMHESRQISLSKPNRNPSSVTEHRKIFKAIEEKNSEAASRHMLEHLYIIRENIREYLKKNEK